MKWIWWFLTVTGWTFITYHAWAGLAEYDQGWRYLITFVLGSQGLICVIATYLSNVDHTEGK